MNERFLYNAIVLGGGPAGYSFAEKACKTGLKVALFEKHKLGGVCLNEGCIPSKCFLTSAKKYSESLNSAVFGVTSESVVFDQTVATEHKDKVVNELTMGVRGRLRKNKVKLIFSKGTIVSRNEEGVCVADEEGNFYLAKNLVIATGSHNVFPDIEGLSDAYSNGFLLTSSEVFDIIQKPERVVVIGGGVIGIELACYFSKIGSSVSVIEASDKIGGSFEPECSSVLLDNLSRGGIEFFLNTRAEKIDGNTVVCKSTECFSIEFDKIILCVGRRANIDGFGLEKTGILLNNGSIVTDLRMQTNIAGIYAIGDVNGKSMLAHTAYREADVCLNSILGIKDEMDYSCIPSVIYSFPEAAAAGMTEQEMQANDLKFSVLKLPLNYSGRFVAENDGYKGICKLIFDENDVLRGAFIVSSYASEIILSLSNMIISKTTKNQMNKFIYPHPTVGEIIKEIINS